MTCDEARLGMEDLRRGTLPAAAAADLRAHVLACPACAAALEDGDEIARAVTGRATRYGAPPAFRDGLRAALAREGLLAAPARPRRRGLQLLRPALLAPAAAAVVLGAVGAAVWFRPWAPEPPRLVAPLTAVVEEHQRAVLLLQAQPAPPPLTPEAVRARLGPQAGYGPILRFAGSEEYRLADARPSYFLARPAASVTFAHAGRLATYLVFPGKDVVIPEAGRVQVGTFKPHLAELAGLRVVTWREGEWACALAGDLDRQEILDLFLKVRKG
jgi:anti-sigma factor RsiW